MIKNPSYLIICLVCLTFILARHSVADEATPELWQIDRIGLYEFDNNLSLGRNIWDGYSQMEAIEALNRLPDILSEKVYRDIVKRLLLSESRAQEEDINAPSLLTKRLNLLIRYGFLDEVEALLAKVENEYDLDNIMDIALIRLKLSLIDGDLAAACLDIQAASSRFRDMPAWRELTVFCRYRFETAAIINMDDLNFRHYPNLNPILTGRISDLQDMMDLELLIAHADQRLFDDQSYKTLARQAASLKDSIIHLASDAIYNDKDTYQCYVIEAAQRGLRTPEYLQDAYTNAFFSEELLKNKSGQVRMHPCSVPAFFYQKMATTQAKTDKQNLLNAFFRATTAMPIQVMVPFIDFMDGVELDDLHHWRAALVLASGGFDIPKTFLPAALPLKNILIRKNMRDRDYRDWADIDLHERILAAENIDIAAPLYFLQILAEEIDKFTNTPQKTKYENIFSLTYAKKSLHLGLGFTGFMSALVDNDDPVAAFTRLLSLTAGKDVQDYSTNDVAVILSVLKAYKLEKEYVALAFEYLQ